MPVDVTLGAQHLRGQRPQPDLVALVHPTSQPRDGVGDQSGPDHLEALEPAQAL